MVARLMVAFRNCEPTGSRTAEPGGVAGGGLYPPPPPQFFRKNKDLLRVESLQPPAPS